LFIVINMILGFILFVSSAFGADIIVKNKTTIQGDFDISIAPYISEEISIRVRSGVIEKNQILIGLKVKINDNLSSSFNVFLQNQRKHNWALDYGPLFKMDLVF